MKQADNGDKEIQIARYKCKEIILPEIRVLRANINNDIISVTQIA